VRLAHHLAAASDWIRGDCVTVNEFPEMAQRYRVMAVPKVVINETVQFEGALPETAFVDQLLRAANGGSP
jgi:hypothetical protein